MNTLVANPGMLKAMRRLSKDAAIQKFLQKAAAGKLKVAKEPDAGRSKAPGPSLADPTPERAAQSEAGAVQKVTTPPFNTRVVPVVSRYADRLGPETLLALESLYELGRKGEVKRGLTAGYDGFKVDVSRTSYAHLTPAESAAHEKFRRSMACLPPELRRVVMELLFDEADGRKPLEIARELCRYDGEHHQRGALVATLRIIAWCVRAELAKGGRDGKGRARKTKEVLVS